MKIRSNIPKSSGIYMLRSKTDPELFYIGSTRNLYARYFHHRKLRKDRSQNPYISGHIKKYGKDDLIFTVIERCDEDRLMEREQYYISELSPSYNVFRFTGIADSSCNLAREVAFKDMGGQSIFNQECLLLQTNKLYRELIIPFNI